MTGSDAIKLIQATHPALEAPQAFLILNPRRAPIAKGQLGVRFSQTDIGGAR
jgi:hypothetical protein